MTTLIGLGGALRSGKDTVADYLVDNHEFVKLNMSDTLANILYILNPVIPLDEEMYDEMYNAAEEVTPFIRYRKIHDAIGYVEAKKNKEVRRLLQSLGTEVGRDIIDVNLWTNLAARNIEKHLSQGTSVAITGIRFPNEVEMISSLGGHSVYVLRPELDTAGTIAAHASETSLSEKDFEYTLVNESTLKCLYESVEKLLETLDTEWKADVEYEYQELLEHH